MKIFYVKKLTKSQFHALSYPYIHHDLLLYAYLFLEFQSENSSPRADNSGDCEDFTTLRSQFFSNQIGDAIGRTGVLNESLFDEGLRIAAQYGMADFAQELKQMTNDPETENANENGTSENGDGVNGHSKKLAPETAEANGDESKKDDKTSTENQKKVSPLKLSTVNGEVAIKNIKLEVDS